MDCYFEYRVYRLYIRQYNNFMTDIVHLIRPKTVPIRSIALTKIDQGMPNHDFICSCQLCSTYQSKKLSQLLQTHTKNMNDKIHQKIKNKHSQFNTFYLWTIKHLVIPHNKIISKCLDIFIPQILFYKQGQANNLFCCKEIDDATIKRAHRQKLSNTFIMKIFGDRRRKYRQTINNYLGRKKEEIAEKPKFGTNKKQTKKQSRDGVVIKYTDGLEQLISQNQFLHLFQRRKQDPLWKQIYYIKNYIAVENPAYRIMVVRYNYANVTYEKLYQRAYTIMRIYGQNISKGEKNYISDSEQLQFTKKLTQQSLLIYSQYLLYKIACYVQYFYDEKILQMTAKFLINQMGQGYLEDVMKLKHESLVKFEWTNQAYLRKIQQEQQRVFFSKEVRPDEQMLKKANQIQKQMSFTYEKMKQHFGLSMQEQDDKEQIKNNQFFKIIHPEIQHPISEILRSSGVTIQKFKRDYLGYKPKKKPLVKPFNSNMIKSLHSMAPQFHRAQVHQYISVPKRTVSTAFSKFSRASSCKRHSSSLKKTHTGLSSFNTTVATPRGD